MSPGRGTERSPGRRLGSGLGVLLAVVLVALVTVGWLATHVPGRAPGEPTGTGASTVTVSPPTETPVTMTRAPEAPVTETPSSGVPSSGSVGSPAAGSVPSAPPAGITWQVWRTLALPYSVTDGPTTQVGDAVGGFARTPTGALLAAVHASGRKLAAGDLSWRQVSRAMIAPGPGRDAWEAVRGATTRPAPPAPGTFAQVAGFQFVSWTPTDAVVQLASRGETGYGVVALHLTWWDDDWRLVLAPDGGDAAGHQYATSLAGFVPWGGV